MGTALYFATVNGQPVQLANVHYTAREASKRPAYDAGIKASESGRTVRCDSFSVAVGTAPDGTKREADRLIFRKAAPSNHKCGARCRHAKGRDCECECGGQFHGAGG